MLKAENEVNATLEELKLGTVWALFSEKWYRVRITSISDGYVEVQSLDYGFRMEKVCYLQLHRLPKGIARSVPGVCIRCHLFQLKPTSIENWCKLWEDFVKRSFVDSIVQNGQIKDQSSSDSMGIIITFKENGSVVNFNQRLVEVGLAKPFNVMNKSKDSGVGSR